MKQRVLDLHDVLDQASERGRLDLRVFSIVDRDFDGAMKHSERRFFWDVYHIENYLLHTEHIQNVMASLRLGGVVPGEAEIDGMLKECAEETAPELLRMQLARYVDRTVMACIRTGVDPASKSLSGDFRASVERSIERLNGTLTNGLDQEALKAEEDRICQNLQTALESGRWRTEFRGRNILRLFTKRAKLGIRYEQFRNLIVNRMRSAGYQPEGMRVILQTILES